MRERFNIFNFAVLILSLILAYDAFAAPIAMPESQRTPIPLSQCDSELTDIIQMSGTFVIATDKLSLQFPNETILGVFWNSNAEVLIVTRNHIPENYIGLQTPTSYGREYVSFRLGRILNQNDFVRLSNGSSEDIQIEAYKTVASSLGSTVMTTISRQRLKLQWAGGQKARLFPLEDSSVNRGVLALEYTQVGAVSNEVIETVVKAFKGRRALNSWQSNR